MPRFLLPRKGPLFRRVVREKAYEVLLDVTDRVLITTFALLFWPSTTFREITFFASNQFNMSCL